MSTYTMKTEQSDEQILRFAQHADDRIPDVHARIREAGGIVHSDGNIFFTRAEQFIVASVLCGELANANLIAAAPELYEACEAILAWDAAENEALPYDEGGHKAFMHRIVMCQEAFDKARAALKKARGEA